MTSAQTDNDRPDDLFPLVPFAARCRAVTKIPYDPHLEEGAEVELDQLSRATADAYLALAAIIGDGLAWPRSAVAARA